MHIVSQSIGEASAAPEIVLCTSLVKSMKSSSKPPKWHLEALLEGMMTVCQSVSAEPSALPSMPHPRQK
jgi:hypothetical protein